MLGLMVERVRGWNVHNAVSKLRLPGGSRDLHIALLTIGSRVVCGASITSIDASNSRLHVNSQRRKS